MQSQRKIGRAMFTSLTPAGKTVDIHGQTLTLEGATRTPQIYINVFFLRMSGNKIFKLICMKNRQNETPGGIMRF